MISPKTPAKASRFRSADSHVRANWNNAQGTRGQDSPSVFGASFINVPFVGNFVGNIVDLSYAEKVCDKVSDKDGTRKW
jgi:hypothetical protein